MATLKWGIIGASGWADHTFGPAISRTPGHALVAVLSSTAQGAADYAERHALNGAYHALPAFLDHPGLDAVWIASPPDIHRAQAIAALRAGKHVLCEKPMAINTSDCAAMLKAATQAKRQLMVGFNNRTNPTLQKLAKAVAAGKFGDILEARAQMYAAYATPPTSWRADKRRSGGWALGDIGTHLLDLVGWIMNSPPRAAQGHLTSRCWQLAIDDHAQVQILYQNGAVGSVTACTGAQGGPSRLEFFGSRGYFRLEGGLFAKPGTLEIAFTGKAPTHETLDAFDTYTAQISQFGAAVRGKPTLLASGADGATNIKLVSAARGW